MAARRPPWEAGRASAGGKLAALAVAVALAASGCSRATPVEWRAATVGPEPLADGRHLGWLDADPGGANRPAPPSDDRARRTLAIAFVVLDGSGWTRNRLAAHAGGLAERLRACAIALAPIPVTALARPDPDWRDRPSDFAWVSERRWGDMRHPILFVRRIGASAHPGIEGRSFPTHDPAFAVIAAPPDAAGHRQAKQTLAHEVGHLLSLGHVSGGPIDVMTPTGCRTCHFARWQCARLRAALADRADPAAD